MSTILGHDRVVAALARDLERGTVSHAYLFAGPASVGKYTVAKAFATDIVLAESEDKDGAARSIAANRHPMITTVNQLYMEEVQEDMEVLAHSSNYNQAHRAEKPAAKTDTLGVADVAEIVRPLYQSHAGHHVVLMRRIERLTVDAAHALLKILEEPPPRTVFVLTTDHVHQILPTLVSRCRMVTFGTLDEDVVADELGKRYPHVSPEDIRRIQVLSLGRFGRALTLASDPDRLRVYTEYFTQVKELFGKRNIARRLELAERAGENARTAQHLLEVMTYFVRSFLLSRARSPVADSRYSTGHLLRILREIDCARDDVAHHVAARVTLEKVLLMI